MVYLKVLVLCLFSFLGAALAANPNREFSVDRTEGYGPLTVTFDASNIKPAKKYYWTFGNGETLTTTNSIVSYSYKGLGSFTASLKFAVNASDKDLKNIKDAGSVLIKVLNRPDPTPNLAPKANISCTTNNLLINCNGLSSYDPEGQPLSFKFDFGDGAVENNTSGLASHAYTVAGLYSVNLTVSDSSGASSQAFTQVQALKPANKLPALNLSCTSEDINTLACNATGSADLDGSIVSYQYAWDDNAVDSKADSSSITHVFRTSGNHTVSLTATDNDGGVSSLSKNFTVKANTNPVVAFTCDTSKPEKVICSSTSTDSDVGDSIQSYSWKFGESSAFSTTTPSTDYDFKAGGAFDVTLVVTDSYGGTGSITQSIAVKSNIAPVAAFTCSNTGIGSIHCESNATDADGAIASSNWSLDDGSRIEGPTLDHKFSSGVEHMISLTVVDDLGTSTTSSQTVQLIINQLPTFEFISNVVTGTAPLAVHFQIQNAVDVDGTIASTSLEFGDNTSSALADVTHSYSTAGTYTVTARVIDDLGGVTIKTKQIIVQAPVIVSPPQAYFKYFQDGTYLELHANITKTQYDIKRAFYTVDGSQTIELSEFYPNTINTVDVGNFGLHTIKLTVIDTTGQTGVFTHSFELKEDLSLVQPFVTFNVRQSSPRTVFVNMNGVFTSDFDEDIEYFHVEYGNGFSEDIYDDTFATYTYPQAGSYLIKVTAVTTRQTQASATRNITITNNEVAVVQPVAAFAYNIYQFAQNVTFYNERSGSPNGGIISYLWDFGDGSTGTGELAAHFYNPGSYFVKLTVTDFAGFTSSQTQHIIVVGAGDDIAANISCWDDGNLKISCNFVALDKLNQINRVKVIWGDGTNNIISTAVIPEYGFYEAGHMYAAAGDKTIQLFVGTSRGVSKTISMVKNVESLTPPVASLSCTSNLLSVTCSTEGSFDPSNSTISFIYDWGDGSSETTTGLGLNHSYASAGNYQIKLTVKNQLGATSTAQQYVTIQNAAMPPISQLACTSDLLTVTCSSAGSSDPNNSVLEFRFNWGDGASNFGANPNFAHTYSVDGLYTISLVVKNESGLTATSTQDILVKNNYIVANLNCYTNNLLVSCNAFGSTDLLGSPLTYIFEYGDGFAETNSSGISSHSYLEGGVYNVKLTVAALNGQTSVVTAQVMPLKALNVLPIAKIECVSVEALKIRCNAFGSSDSDGQIVSYRYEFLDDTVEMTASTDDITHTFNESGMTTARLLVTDNDGGISQTEADIYVNDYPSFKVIAQPVQSDISSPIQFSINIIDTSFGNIQNVDWDFNDGDIATGISTSHKFSTVGTFNVKAKITYFSGLIVSQYVAVSTTSHSNIIIMADSDSGEAPLQVHLDASSSTDPIGNIEKYEWYYLNKKIGEGSFADIYIQDEGAQTVELVVTNSEGTRTSGFKIIHVTKPAIYIKDNFLKYAVSGASYSGSLDIEHSVSIVSENIQVRVENLPVGFSFDELERKYSWVPNDAQRGMHSFKVIASDGIFSFERIVEMEVVKEEVLRVLSVSSNGGGVVLDDPGSVLDKLIIMLPPAASGYSAKVVKYNLSNGVAFNVISEQRGTINFTFDHEVAHEMNFGKSFHKDSTSMGSAVVPIKTGSKCIGPTENINQTLVGREHYAEPVQGKSVGDYYWVATAKDTSNVNFYLHRSTTFTGRIVAEELITRLSNDPVFRAMSVRSVNFYLDYESLTNRLGSNPLELFGVGSFGSGATILNQLDTTFISIPFADVDRERQYADTLQTIFHEFYHIKQSEFLNCGVPTFDWGEHWMSFFEGSAERNGYRALDYSQAVKLLKKEYSVRPDIIKTPFAFGNHVGKGGVFSYENNASKPFGEYNNRLVWDHFNSDLFFKYVQDHYTSLEDKDLIFNKDSLAPFIDYVDEYRKDNLFKLKDILNSIPEVFYNTHALKVDGYREYNEWLYATIKTTDFSTEWLKGQDQLFNDSIAKGHVDNFIYKNESKTFEKRSSTGTVTVFEDMVYKPLSTERIMLTIPRTLEGYSTSGATVAFSTFGYPFYLGINNVPSSEVSIFPLMNSPATMSGLKKVNYFEAFELLEYKLNSIPSAMDWDTFGLNIVNPTSADMKGSIKLKSSCRIIENYSITPPSNNDLGFYSFAPKLNVDCGGKSCNVKAIACLNNFDTASREFGEDVREASTYGGTYSQCFGRFSSDTGGRFESGRGSLTFIGDAQGTGFICQFLENCKKCEVNGEIVPDCWQGYTPRQSKKLTAKVIFCVDGGDADIDDVVVN